ncbi:MAG: hypothetical protein NC396_06600 [Bacteroides sp.]|nr:hypothetical protein [Bacteroides sp.]MCM1086026.1 hypothetical protein [Bacteroides sp.]
MKTSFKWLLVTFALVLLGTIVVVSQLPKPKLSFTERTEINDIINRVNATLPHRMGTIGQWDKVSFCKNTLTYHYSLYGDASISQFYKDNYAEFREMIPYGFLIMNGQQNNGNLLVSLLEDKGLVTVFEFKTPGGGIFRWQYDGIELVEFINRAKATPVEAIQTVLDIQIKLANLSLPMALDDMGNLQSIPVNSMVQSISTGDILLRIYREGNNIIFVIKTAETQFILDDVKAIAQNPDGSDFFASALAEDPDFREFMSLLAIAQADFTYRVRNKNATDSAEVRIPYSVLRKYCSMPQLLK